MTPEGPDDPLALQPNTSGGQSMPKKTIIWVTEDGEGPRLAYRNLFAAGPAAPEATLEQLADLCDQEAESENAHDFVGAHRLLAALLFRRLGRETATAIMREVAELGGLDGMNGICGTDGAYADLGIAWPWKDWKLE
jgi:hypothetical protein